jgi:hypothetical protein
MHTREMKDSEGTFGGWTLSAGAICQKCGAARMMYRYWESHCGGYVDLQYRCTQCGKVHWVEGPDA